MHSRSTRLPLPLSARIQTRLLPLLVQRARTRLYKSRSLSPRELSLLVHALADDALAFPGRAVEEDFLSRLLTCRGFSPEDMDLLATSSTLASRRFLTLPFFAHPDLTDSARLRFFYHFFWMLPLLQRELSPPPRALTLFLASSSVHVSLLALERAADLSDPTFEVFAVLVADHSFSSPQDPYATLLRLCSLALLLAPSGETPSSQPAPRTTS